MRDITEYPYKEKKASLQCEVCGEDIYEGDMFAELSDRVICFECICDMSKKDLILEAGGEILIALSPDDYECKEDVDLD